MDIEDYVTIRLRSLPPKTLQRLARHCPQLRAPAAVRLRKLLKCMLRGFGFRCVEVAPAAARRAVRVRLYEEESA